MTLYESWVSKAYDQKGNTIKKTWDLYMPLEQKIYENMLKTKVSSIKGTVLELSEKYNMPIEFICGFIDGIKDALKKDIEVKDLEETTKINAEVDFKMLYTKMVEYKAEHLYSLPEWDNIFDEQTRKDMYTEQKKSGTIVRETEKIGRNDPCPCNSGKKYKKCCGMAI